jgi:hypothetical protein
VLRGHQDEITMFKIKENIMVSADLGSRGNSMEMLVWDLTTMTQRWSIHGHLGAIHCADFDTTTELLVSGSWDSRSYATS